MEKKLAEFRAKKEAEQKSKQTIFQRVFHKSSTTPNETSLPTEQEGLSSTTTQAHKKAPEHSEKIKTEPDLDDQAEDEIRGWRFYVLLVLKVILWLLLWRYFIELGFGAVFFIISTSFLMYRNTRTGPRKKNRLSAYSVFNPNQERLDGTFTTEQFERELRFGAGSVK